MNIQDDRYKNSLRNVRHCLEVLRQFKDSNKCPENVKGTVGNLIGEVKKIEYLFTNPPRVVMGKVEDILTEYENDPVIRAYVDQKQDWLSKLRDLENQFNDPMDD